MTSMNNILNYFINLVNNEETISRQLKDITQKECKYQMSQVPEPCNSIKIIMEECFNNRKMTNKSNSLKHIKKVIFTS